METSVGNDITLSVEGHEFQCNKRQLSQHSSYFNAMFHSQMQESQASVVMLKEMPSSTVSWLVDYAHGKKPQLTAENINSVVEGACMFQFEAVQTLCCDYLVSTLTISNALAIANVAESLSLQLVYKRAMRLALFYFKDVVETQGFLHMQKDLLITFLSHDALRVHDEIDTFNAVIRWTSWDQDNRSTHLLEIFQSGCIRLTFLDYQTLATVILNDKLVQVDKALSGTLQQAYNCACRTSASSINARQLSDNSASKLPVGNTENSRAGANVCTCAGSKINHPRCCPMAVVLGGGQILNSKTFPDRIEKDISPYLDISYIVEGERKLNRLTSLNEIPQNCVGPSYSDAVGYKLCAVDGDIYVIGGELELGRGKWLRDVWKYDTLFDAWSRETEMTQPRRHHGVIAIGHQIYVVGGFGQYRAILSRTEKYDCDNGQWTSLSPMLQSEYSPSLAVHDRLIYVVKNIVQCYNPCIDQWTKVSTEFDFSTENLTGISNVLAYNNMFYFIGMYSTTLVGCEVHRKNYKNALSSSRILGHFKCSTGTACICGERIFIVGGQESTLVETYNLNSRQFDQLLDLKHNLLQHCTFTMPSYFSIFD